MQTINKRSPEALLNEVKGTMFEYLVAMELARLYSAEENFHNSISADFNTVLQTSQTFLKSYYPELYKFFPEVAKKTADYFYKKNPGNYTSVKLSGRSYQSLDNTADIILQGVDTVEISLKLNKPNSSINTKSAGLKSFINEYFTSPYSQQRQQIFNQKMEKFFFQFCSEIHTFYNLEPEINFAQWSVKKLPELPGDLPDDALAILHHFYHQIAAIVFDEMNFILKNTEYKAGLLRLMGFTHSNTSVLVCFAQTNNANELYFDQVMLIKPENLDLNDLELEFNNNSYLKVKGQNFNLLLRIKPMNKFTTMSYKLNSSVNYSL